MMQEVLPAPALDALDSLAREAALEIGGGARPLSPLPGGRAVLPREGGPPPSMVGGPGAPVLDSLCLLVAGHRGTLIIEDAQRHGEARAGRTLRRLGIRSCVGFPLTPEDTVLGSFCVICDRQRCWQSEEVDLVRRLAAIAAV